jgi:hypothetical protein
MRALWVSLSKGCCASAMLRCNAVTAAGWSIGLRKPLAANALQRDPQGECNESCSFTVRKLRFFARFRLACL